MRSCFATRFGPEPFAAMLSEMRYLNHAHLELLYMCALQASPSAHPSASGPEQFSGFLDKQRFAGTKTTTKYCKGVFVDWMRAHRPFFDRITATLTGKILRGDHSFKVGYQLFFTLIILIYFYLANQTSGTTSGSFYTCSCLFNCE